MRRAARKDTAHKPICQDVEREGVIVLDTSRLGDGFPDAVGWNDGRERYTFLRAMALTIADQSTPKAASYLREIAKALEPLAKHGLFVPFEIKSDNAISKQKKSTGQLKPDQQALHAKVPIPIVRTAAEGLALFGIDS